MSRFVFRRLIDPIVEFLFPPLCLSCDERLSSESERVLCARCRGKLERVRDGDFTMRVLSARFVQGGAVAAFTAAYYFEDHGILQPVIHALKYRDMTSIGRVFGRELGAVLKTHPAFHDCNLIIPIPLHIQKERERGHNQS